MYTRPSNLGRFNFRKAFVRINPAVSELTTSASIGLRPSFPSFNNSRGFAWGRLIQRAQGLGGIYEGDSGDVPGGDSSAGSEALTGAQLNAQTNIAWESATAKIPVISGTTVVPTNEYVPIAKPKSVLSQFPVKYIALGIGGVLLLGFLMKRGR